MREPTGGAPALGAGVQTSLDELGTPLRNITFCVFDLETTGGSPADAAITEIGAVKVRGGELLGEFASLVDPGAPVPPYVSVLTGITDAMVTTAPRLEGVLPMFLEFADGATLVAHNAPFDIGFLRTACMAHGHPWPAFAVVDTADLARRVLNRDEVPNCRLATLARFFRSSEQPRHRALADARATVDVLHGLLERVGCFGVQTLEELAGFSRTPTPGQHRKRHLADGLPATPGVYLFQDADGEVLYVGKSGNLRNRVRTYFTAAETRARVREMVGLAARVVPVVCSTGLEAEVRELRLIAAHKPRYNRRSRHPERMVWLKLTAEPFPRLALVRQVRDDRATYLGPFGSSRSADQARAALYETFPLRQCTGRLSANRRWSACALAEMGRCGAPCEGRQSVAEYALHADAARTAMVADARPVVAAVEARMDRLRGMLRYEEAAVHRDRLAAFVRGAARTQRLATLASCRHLVAARPGFEAGWELSIIRYGRLAGASTVPRSYDPRPYVDALVATAETVPAGPGPAPAASAEEMECVLRWLESPGVRLVEMDGTWALPIHGAESVKARIGRAYPHDARQD